MRISTANFRGSIGCFMRWWCNEPAGFANAARLPLLGPRPDVRGARSIERRAGEARSRRQFQVGSRHGGASLRRGSRVVLALAGAIAGGLVDRRGVSGCVVDPARLG